MTHDLNFLEATEPEPIQEQRQRRRLATKILLIAVIVIGVLLFVSGLISAQVMARTLDGQEAVERAQDSLLELRLDDAQEALSEAETDFSRAALGLRFFSFLKPVPWLGEQVKASQGILEAGAVTSGTLLELLELVEDVVSLAVGTEALLEDFDFTEQFSWSELTPEIKESILLRLASSASDLELAQVDIGLVLRDLEEVSEDELIAPLRVVLDQLETKLSAFDHTLDALIPAAFVLPSVAGLEQEQHILLLFLNNAEMRPGGGFIGSYGVVTMKDAELVSLETHGVMDVDAPAEGWYSETPPAAIAQYLTNDTWYFRDSNWSPDFAVSTETGLRLFHDEIAEAPEGTVLRQPYTSFDAVIGITPDLVSDILELVGSIELDGQTFSADNIMTTLEYAVEYGFLDSGIPYDQRKEIIGELADIMLERLFALPASGWQKVFEAVGNALQTKHLAIYSADPTVLEVIARKDWAGRVFPGDVDTLMVVDANMASLKTDPAVQRTIDYSITRDASDKLVGRVDITYDHTGDFDWKTTRYRTYTRVYVPLGSELISSEGSLANDKLKNPDLLSGTVDVTEELDLTVFGTFTSIEPGESRTLSFEYYLPDSVAEAVDFGVYELEVIKQIGAAAHDLQLNFDFDKSIKAAYPGEEPDQFGDDRYIVNTILDQNKKFVVEF